MPDHDGGSVDLFHDMRHIGCVIIDAEIVDVRSSLAGAMAGQVNGKAVVALLLEKRDEMMLPTA
jgi:hypothetical protein